MKIDVFPNEDQINKFRDLESVLLNRKRNGKIAGNLAMASFIVQVLVMAWPMIAKIIPFFDDALYDGYGDYFRDPRVFIPLFFGIILAALYFLFRRTSILLKETSEPFRYTFFVEAFKEVDSGDKGNFELKNIKRVNLLHHDLTELINNRIKRFSILEHGKKNDDNTNITDLRRSNHIQIYGHYAIREDKDNDDWVIHIMPYVRIGMQDSPSTLAQSVRYPLSGDNTPDVLDTLEYNQMLERVYSQVTTEVYSQIEKDIRDKIDLFPTPYLQAKAFFYEAEDMAKSNTINSFDSAIELYKEAIKKCDLTFQRQLIGFFNKVPVVRTISFKFLYQYAHILIGHAKCLIFKKRISVLSGRKTNPIFEIRQNLSEIIGYLEYFLFTISKNEENQFFRRDRKTFFNLAYFSFPRDNWYRKVLLKPSNKLFDDARKLLFDAYVIHALADTVLHTLLSARKYLSKARAIAPDLSSSDVLYKLTEGYLEPNIERALLVFQQVTEKDPTFQIAQYDLAYWTEMKFRKDGNIDRNRARSVLEEYDKVLKINPGNIAALAAQGHILWLIKDFDKARRKFKEGIEIKALVSETYIGLLIYGLARIMAEQGQVYQSYELFNQAIAANPNVGAFTMNDSWIVASFYEYVTPNLLKRYEEYLENFNNYKHEKRNIIGIIEDKNDEIAGDLKNGESVSLLSYLKNIKFSTGSIRISASEMPNQWIMEITQNASMKHYRKEVYDIKKSGPKIIISNIPAENVVNTVSSYVSNDVGNAVMNYYKRFGGEEFLNRAIQIFSDAISNYNNVVSKYNKSLAVALKNPNAMSESVKLLDEVFQECPKWIDAWASYFEFVVRSSGSFNMYKEKVKQLEEIIFKEEQELKIERGETSASPQKKVHDDQSEDTNIETSEKRVVKADKLNYSERQMSRIRSLKEEKEELSRKEVEKVLEILGRIVAATNLITLYNGFQLENLESAHIEEFLDKNINWMRLDEEDVRALRIYASWLYHDYCKPNEEKSEQKILTMKKIFDHILANYYPEDFDILQKKKKILEMANGSGGHFENISTPMTRMKLTPALFRKLDDGNIPSEIRQHLFDSGTGMSPTCKLVVEKRTDGYFLMGDTDEDPRYFLKRNGKWVSVFSSDLQFCDQAIEALTRYGIEMDPINYDRLAYSTEILKPGKNLLHLEKATQLASDNKELYVLFYRSCYKAGKLNDFIQKFERSDYLKEQPAKMAAIYFDIGNYVFKAKNRGGEQYFEKAVKNYWDAIDFAKTTKESLHDLDDYYDYLAEASYKAGKLKEFVEKLESSGGLNSRLEKKAFIYNSLGTMLFRDGFAKEAIEYYIKALKLDRTKPVYYANLARMYSQPDSPDWNKAQKLYQQSVDKRKSTTTDEHGLEYYYELLAEASYRSGRLKEFIKRFEQTNDLDEQPAEKAIVYNSVGNLLYRDGQSAEAMVYYQKAIEFDNNTPIYYVNLGLMHASVKPPDWHTAELFYKRAVNLRKNTLDDPYGFEYYYDYYAEVAYKTGKLEEFLTEFEESSDIKNQPAKKAVIYNTIGNNLYRDYREREAIVYYKKAIQFDGERPIYFANLALMYASIEEPDWNKAHEYYQKALDIRKKAESDPYGVEYYYDYLAEASYKTQKLDVFLENFEKSGDLQDTLEKKAVVYNSLGNAFYRDARIAEAIPYYEKAIEIDSAKPVYHSNLGLMYASLKPPDWNKSMELRQKAVDIRKRVANDPYGLDHYYGYLAESCYYARRLDEFVDILEASKDLNDQPIQKASIYNKLGNYLFGDYLPADAIPYYEKAIQLDSAKPIYYSNLGQVYSKMAPPDWGKALNFYHQALELRKTTPDDYYGLDYYYNFLAEASYKSGNLVEFLTRLNGSKDLDDQPSQKAVIINNLGNSLFQDLKTLEAIPFYEMSMQLDPEKPVYYANLGLMYSKLDPPDWARAFDYYKQALALRKKALEDAYGLDYYYNYLAEASYNTGKLEEFLMNFDASKDLDDQPAQKAIIYNAIGNYLLHDSRKFEAKMYYERAIHLDNRKPVYYANLGLMYSRLDPPEWHEALDYYQQALDIRRETPTDSFGLDYYLNYLAEASYKTGKLDDFVLNLEASGDLDNQPVQKAILFNSLGNYLYQEFRRFEAIQFYVKAIELDPDRPIYYANLGLMYSLIDPPDWLKAQDCYRQALEIRRETPYDPYELSYYYNYLAEASYKTGKLAEFVIDFDTSRDFDDQPVQKAIIFNNIGNYLYQDFRCDDAISYYEKAIALDGERPIYYANLGLSYSKLDPPDWGKALDCYRQALEIRRKTPDDPYALNYYYNYLIEASYKAGKLSEFMEQFKEIIESDASTRDEVLKKIEDMTGKV